MGMFKKKNHIKYIRMLPKRGMICFPCHLRPNILTYKHKWLKTVRYLWSRGGGQVTYHQWHNPAGRQGLITIILATWEAEIKRITL
jgi:hypothetical protein